MLVKTEAIVLGSVKYGDNSVILRTYSEEYGLISFIAGGIHSKKGAIRPAMIQVLSVLQIVFYDKAKGELKRIKEVSVPHPLQEVFYDPIKSGLAMLFAEILQHVIHEEEPNPGLYRFLRNTVYELDNLQEAMGSYHLVFLYKLTTFLGFQPEAPQAKARFFDLINGVFEGDEPMHAQFLHGTSFAQWVALHEISENPGVASKFSLEERRQVLSNLILYYRLHVKDFGKLKSLEVLSEVLS